MIRCIQIYSKSMSRLCNAKVQSKKKLQFFLGDLDKMMGDKLGRSFKWWEGKDVVEAIKSCSAVKKKNGSQVSFSIVSSG